jgi:hypothetical protein
METPEWKKFSEEQDSAFLAMVQRMEKNHREETILGISGYMPIIFIGGKYVRNND